MLQDEQREQDSLLAWFGDGLYDKPSPAPKKTLRTAADYLPTSFFTSGETLIAISLYEFLLRFLPEIIQAVAALL